MESMITPIGTSAEVILTLNEHVTHLKTDRRYRMIMELLFRLRTENTLFILHDKPQLDYVEAVLKRPIPCKTTTGLSLLDKACMLLVNEGGACVGYRFDHHSDPVPLEPEYAAEMWEHMKKVGPKAKERLLEVI